jgi:hypothetical protein
MEEIYQKQTAPLLALSGITTPGLQIAYRSLYFAVLKSLIFQLESHINLFPDAEKENKFKEGLEWLNKFFNEFKPKG